MLAFLPIFAIAIVACVATVLVLATRAAARASMPQNEATALSLRLGVGIAAWLSVLAGVAASGALGDFEARPPRPLLLLVATMVLFAITTRRKIVGRLLEATPDAWLVALQTMRIPIELMLYGLFVAGKFPIHLTFEGRNFDVLVGLSAPVMALLASRGKLGPRGLVAWHVVSLGLLANIVFMAVTTLPGPLHLAWPGASNVVVTTFPYVYLPGFLVPVALFGHVLALRKLAKRARPSAEGPAAGAPPEDQAQRIGGGV